MSATKFDRRHDIHARVALREVTVTDWQTTGSVATTTELSTGEYQILSAQQPLRYALWEVLDQQGGQK